MTRIQAKWAETHDWWQGTMEDWDNNYTVIVTDGINFDDFDLLYIWAGY